LSAFRTSLRSRAALKRRLRCWLSLARGATPSTAMNSRSLGRAICVTMRSMYLNMPSIISRSVSEFAIVSSFGCEHAWMMPFMSRYRLSNSGSCPRSVISWLIFGYRSDSQR
jgi:hypothetical protein